ncbi:hypothetical protein QYF61_003770, partial [Mycteria americana]
MRLRSRPLLNRIVLRPFLAAFASSTFKKGRKQMLQSQEVHRIPVNPFLQPLKVLLNGSTITWYISHSSQFRMVCKLAGGALSPIIQIFIKDVKQYWPYYQSLGYTTRDLLPTGLCTADHNPICPADQPVLNLIVRLSNPRFISLSMRMLWETGSKALLKAALNPFITQSVLILMIALIQVQDLALGLELHEVHVGQLLKPVKVPLDGIPSLKQINYTTRLGVTCKLAEGALNPTVLSLIKIFNITSPNTDPRDNAIISQYWASLSDILHHESLKQTSNFPNSLSEYFDRVKAGFDTHQGNKCSRECTGVATEQGKGQQQTTAKTTHQDKNASFKSGPEGIKGGIGRVAGH